MQSIEYNKENHSIVNQMYDILAELQAQDKNNTLCKVNEDKDKVAKQAIDMQGMTTTKLSYTDYYLIIIRARNSKRQWGWKNSIKKLHYIKLQQLWAI